MPPTGDWRHPFTHQTYRRVPTRLAARLDAIAAQAQHQPDEPHSIERSRHRTRILDQLQHLLAAFGNRDAYRRLVDEIGDPLSFPEPLVGGAAAGAGGYTLLWLQSARRWRTIYFNPHSHQQPEELDVLLDAHRLAARLVERDREDPDAGLALNAVCRLLWAVAEVQQATFEDTDDGRVFVADELQPNEIEVLQEVDAAARALQVHLAARDEQTARQDARAHDATFPSILRRRATRRELRARTRRVRKLEDAEAAAELARLAGEDLARAQLEDEQPRPTDEQLKRAGLAHRIRENRAPVDADIAEIIREGREDRPGED